MNLSGESIRGIVDYYKVDPEEGLLVIYDDISLSPGQIRFLLFLISSYSASSISGAVRACISLFIPPSFLHFLSGYITKAKQVYEDYRFLDGDTYLYPAKDLLFYQADIRGREPPSGSQ